MIANWRSLWTSLVERFKPVPAPIQGVVSHLSPRDDEWGRQICWLNWPDTISGHMPFRDRLVEGDLVAFEMRSGRAAVFRITKLKWMSNPPDQFFADVETIGYADEHPGVIIQEGQS